MGYHTVEYLFVFLPLALLSYQIIPQKFRWCVLLVFGYLFFWLFSGKLVVFLIATTLFTYGIGMLLQRLKKKCRIEKQDSTDLSDAVITKQYKKKEKIILVAGITGLLVVLGYLKYYNFFAYNINHFFALSGNSFRFEIKNLLLPIGISFYTLQAISYMADVYWEKIKGHQPLGKVALFLGFFPQIMEGPISMYHQTADCLWEGNSLKKENLSNGAMRILWGLFKKMIIADRLNVVVKSVFDNYETYAGAYIFGAAVAYTIQLYMEFSGCMDIVIGSGKMFGVSLPENFRQPFFAQNASEFWRRWHITLGEWFKTYIFYPVSVSGLVKKWNRFGKKHFGKYIAKLGVTAMALFPVWMCNGLWHGAKWSYIFYGMYYFVILFLEVALEPFTAYFYKKCHINRQAWGCKIFRLVRTWLIIVVGELFFRASGLRIGMKMFSRIFTDFGNIEVWHNQMESLGLDTADYFVIFLAVIIVMIVEIIKEKQNMKEFHFYQVALPIRWCVFYALILSVIIFGAYGIGYQQVDLIYANF